jgi:hypothetical protein
MMLHVRHGETLIAWILALRKRVTARPAKADQLGPTTVPGSTQQGLKIYIAREVVKKVIGIDGVGERQMLK